MLAKLLQLLLESDVAFYISNNRDMLEPDKLQFVVGIEPNTKQRRHKKWDSMPSPEEMAKCLADMVMEAYAGLPVSAAVLGTIRRDEFESRRPSPAEFKELKTASFDQTQGPPELGPALQKLAESLPRGAVATLEVPSLRQAGL